MQELQEIDQLASNDDSNFQSVETSLGSFWRSEHVLKAPKEYSTPLPAGLHLGGGIADISIYSESFGRHGGSGPMLNIVSCPPGFEEEFHTSLGAGPNTSCGLFVPFCEFEQLPKPVRSLMQLLPREQMFYSSTRIRRSIIARLCSPFEPWRNASALRLAGEARVYELLALLIESMACKGPRLKKHLQQKIILARELINGQLNKPPSLAELARQVGLNVRSLTHYFRQAYGMSIGEYQHHQRMEKALQLLEAGLSVSQTADQLGYSLPYFSQKFRQQYGVSASEISPSALDHNAL